MRAMGSVWMVLLALAMVAGAVAVSQQSQSQETLAAADSAALEAAVDAEAAAEAEAVAEVDGDELEDVYGRDDDLPFWGNDNTEVDVLDQHNELVLLEAGLDTSDAHASADADADEDSESDADADEDVYASDSDSDDSDADAADAADAAVAVEPENSHHSAESIAATAQADASAAGMADREPIGTSFVEHDTRFRHDVPLQASTWAAMLLEAKGYQSNALRARSRSSSGSGVKGGPCAGVISANCKHTADMQGGIGQAEKWQEECGKLICNPLCLRYTWDVKIVAAGGPEGFEDAVNALGTQYSLGAQFRAHACGKVAGCCEENKDLLDWVELRNFAGGFPNSPQPALACDLRANAKNEDQTPTKDDLCSQCKEAITVEAEPKEDACDYFVKVPDPVDMGDEVEVFARNGESAGAQKPKHKSFKEKCEAVQGLMAGIISGLASGEWKEKACSCLGCCEEEPGSECYYPVTYATTDEAHKAHKS